MRKLTLKELEELNQINNNEIYRLRRIITQQGKDLTSKDKLISNLAKQINNNNKINMENKNLKQAIEYSNRVKNINLDIDDIASISINIVDDFMDNGLCPIPDQGTTSPDDETHFEYQDIIREHLETLFKIK